jgi:tRNA(adenine34) deaminase
MCAGAIQNSRIDTVVFGIADPKGGATSSLYNVCADPRLNHETKVIGPTNPLGYANSLRNFFRTDFNATIAKPVSPTLEI